MRDSEERFVKITQEIKKDIAWLLKFMPQFYGTAKYVPTPPCYAHTIAVDASLLRVGILVSLKTNVNMP